MKGSILIVEDNLDQLNLLKLYFIQAGYQVTGVHHPRQALEAASFQQFQVALLDLSLPEMDGIELMQRLQRSQDEMQFIILSGYQYPYSQANADGAFACLVKPYNLKVLEATVEKALDSCLCRSPSRAEPTLPDSVAALS